MTDDNLDRLRALTARLADFIVEESSGSVEYEAEGGVVTGYGLYNQPDVSVQRAYFPDGVTLPKHAHVQHEHVMIVSGRFWLRTNGVEREMTVGDGAYFPPGQEHSLSTLEAGWVIGVLIPGSVEDFPSVE